MSFVQQFKQYSLPQLTNGVKLPDFKIEDKYFKKYNLKEGTTDYEFLCILCNEGLEKKIGKSHSDYQKYQKKLKEELQTFKDLGFCSYVLITWDIVNYCRENQIPTGLARGSGAGSLVLFLSDIVSKIDPLKYGLYFERFLSKTRAKFKTIDGVNYYKGDLLMDVDLDISDLDRHRLITWLENKYKGRIAKLLTVSTLSSKILVKEVSKIMDDTVTEDDANRTSNMIPVLHGKVSDIESAIEESPDFKFHAEQHPENIKICKKLHGLTKHFGVHASAWIISADNLSNLCPVQLTKKNELVCSYTMDDALSLAIKVDLLGLKCATLIDRVCKMVGLTVNDLDPEDTFIYQSLQDFTQPYNCFQISAETNFRVTKKVKPKNLNDLSAVVALARPGALAFVDQYAKFVETGEIQSIHPFLDSCFSDSGGLCLYQESLLRAANKIGFTLEESEILRRVIGKKKTEDIKEWQGKIKEKIKENNIPVEVGDILWKIAEESASYSFNRAHSVAYGALAGLCVLLKFKYPKEFFLVSLEMSKDEADSVNEIAIIQSELPHFGMKLLPPDIQKSKLGYSIEGNDIRMGLSCIKGVSNETINKVSNFTTEFSNKFQIFEGAENAKLNINVLGNLILTGAFSCLDMTITRARLFFEARCYRKLNDTEKKYLHLYGSQFNFDLVRTLKYVKDNVKTDKGKEVVKASRYETIKKNVAKYIIEYDKMKSNEKLSCWHFEKKCIGFSYTTSLHEIYKKDFPDLITVEQFKQAPEGKQYRIIAEITYVKLGESKKKTPMLRCSIKDDTGQINALAFNTDKNKTIDDILENNAGKSPEEDDVAIIYGTKKGDALFVNSMRIQNIVFKYKKEDESKATGDTDNTEPISSKSDNPQISQTTE